MRRRKIPHGIAERIGAFDSAVSGHEPVAAVETELSGLPPDRAVARLFDAPVHEYARVLELIEADERYTAAVETIARSLCETDTGDFPYRSVLATAVLFARAERDRALPSGWLDKLLERAVALDCAAGCGSLVPDYLSARIHLALILLPIERRQPIVLGGDRTRWKYLPDCPTPTTIDRAMTEICSWGTTCNMYAAADAARALPRFGPAAVPAILQALRRKPPQRAILLKALGQTGLEAAIPVLIAALADSHRGAREAAVHALSSISLHVLSPLDAVLRGRNKLARTAAVDVLCSLPPRHPAVARALTSALEAIDDSALQARLRSRINDDSG